MPLPDHLASLEPPALLAWAIQTYGDAFAVCTSFQSEGMVILDMAVRIRPAVRVFTIDTGRLPEETYQMIDSVRRHYGIEVEIVVPDHTEVQAMTSRHGINLFHHDVALRKLCCHVRKVRPLERKLAEFRAWAVGLRREQSEERAGIQKVEEADGRVKLSPLADWSKAQVDDYLDRFGAPRHPLESRGYLSIGCAPCTRPVGPGEPDRAGRWWWEQNVSKECGIHVAADGELRRTLDVLLEDILVH